jgi:hypothetical protein
MTQSLFKIYLTDCFLIFLGAIIAVPSISAIHLCIDRLIPLSLSSATGAYYTVVAVVDRDDFGGLEDSFFFFYLEVVGIVSV